METRNLEQVDTGASLCQAVETGDVKLITSLLKEGFEAGETIEHNQNATHVAVINGHPKALECLIEHGFNINYVDVSSGRNLLHHACLNGNYECISYVLKNCADMHNMCEKSAVFSCWELGNVKPSQHAYKLGELVTEGYVINEDKYHRINVNVDETVYYSLSPLHISAAKGFLSSTLLLLKHCNVDIRDNKGKTPLHYACQYGNIEVAIALMEAGSDVNLVNLAGVNALMYCIIYSVSANDSFYDLVSMLIKNGIKLDTKTNSDFQAKDAAKIASVCGNSLLVDALLKKGVAEIGKMNDLFEIMSYAIQSCHDDVVEVCLKHGALNRYPCNYFMYCAADLMQPGILKLLLQYGADPAAVYMEKTALAISAQRGCEECVKLLVATKIAINKTDSSGMTPLHWAITKGHITCVTLLLEHGADPNMRNIIADNTALILAVETGSSEIVRLLINSQCNVNAVTTTGKSALHEAADRGYLDICELLIPCGAYVDMQTSEGDTPLMLATRNGHSNVASYLLDLKCDVHLVNNKHETALHESALYGHSRLTKMLIQAGSDINLADTEGDTPLLIASMKGHSDVVLKLVENKCKINHTNEMSRSALMEAAEHGHSTVVEILIAAGANVNITDAEHDTALTLAAAKYSGYIVNLLVKSNCNIQHANRWGRTALHEACGNWKARPKTVEILLSAGISPDVQDDMHNSPLILATLAKNGPIIRELLKGNCDVNLPGRTEQVGRSLKPIQIAVTNESMEIAQMFYLCGCDINPVNVWMDSPQGYIYAIPVKTVEFKTWLEGVTSKPPPLKVMCRYVIRKCLGYTVKQNTKPLPLPKQIKQYIALNDLDQFEFKQSADNVM